MGKRKKPTSKLSRDQKAFVLRLRRKIQRRKRMRKKVFKRDGHQCVHCL